MFFLHRLIGVNNVSFLRTSFILFNPKPLMRQSQQNSSAFLVCLNVQDASMANSVDPDQTAPVLGPRCLLLYLIRQ